MLDLNNKKIALLFAGQGAQYIGMGKDLYEKFDYVKDMYDQANQILGYNVTDICFKENNFINQTKYTQPAMLITSIAIYEVLKRHYILNPSVIAGFSLGEYSALYAAKVFDFPQIVELINYRSLYMHECALENKGAMAAIIGMHREKLQELCNEIKNVSIANYNCPNQLVVGGLDSSIEELCLRAKDNGAKRAIKLNVSGAFHTTFMSQAAAKLYEVIKKYSYNKPKVDVIMNCNSSALQFEYLPELMKKQIESSVYFEDTIRKMINEYHIDLFIEIGPGNVLSGFVKKIDATKDTISLNNLNDLGLKQED